MSALASQRFSVADDFGAVFTDMYKRGFTDGLPVIPAHARACEVAI